MAGIRIPAEVDQPDRLVAGLTARQLFLLATTGVFLYAGWGLTRTLVPLPVFLVAALPIAVAGAVLALGQRDGLPLDRVLLAALRQRLAPRHRVAAPDGLHPAPAWLTAHATTRPATADAGHRPVHHPRSGADPVAAAPLQLPAQAVRTTAAFGTDAGIVDLGADGLAAIAVASTVNFALRSPGEQEALVAGFARYLHSLSAPVQILVRTERLDLTAQIRHLAQQAALLPHPALEAAAHEHARYLHEVAGTHDLLRRQVLLVLRDPGHSAFPPAGAAVTPSVFARVATLATGRRSRRQHTVPPDHAARRAAETRLIHRLGDAVELLAAAGIVLTPLDSAAATAVLAACCNPDTLLPIDAGLAGAEDIISTPGGVDTFATTGATTGEGRDDDYWGGADVRGDRDEAAYPADAYRGEVGDVWQGEAPGWGDESSQDSCDGASYGGHDFGAYRAGDAVGPAWTAADTATALDSRASAHHATRRQPHTGRRPA